MIAAEEAAALRARIESLEAQLAEAPQPEYVSSLEQRLRGQTTDLKKMRAVLELQKKATCRLTGELPPLFTTADIQATDAVQDLVEADTVRARMKIQEIFRAGDVIAGARPHLCFPPVARMALSTNLSFVAIS